MVNTEDFLSAHHEDIIGEVFNMCLGSSTMAMHTMLGKTVNITTPDVSVIRKDDFHLPMKGPAMAVEIHYVEGLQGRNLLIMEKEDIRKILEIMMMTEFDPENFEVDEIGESAICELMNQMMGMASTSMSRFLEMTVNISIPETYRVRDEESFKQHYFSEDDVLLIVGFDITIEETLQSKFYNIMSFSFAKDLLAFIEAVQKKHED